MATELKEAIEEQSEEIEDIVPRGAHRQQVLGVGDDARIYTQKPLSFFGKMQFFEVLGRAVDHAMQGDSGLTLAGLLGGSPTISTPEGATITIDNFAEADTFVQGIAKLATYAPEMLLELYCIWLGVPTGERAWAKDQMQKTKEEGGLSDEDGVEIAETFIDQNAEALQSFFVDRLMPLVKRTRNRLGVEQPQQPKPSRATRRSTPKASKSS